MFNRIRIGTGGASARLSRLTAVVSALLVACSSASRAAGIEDAVMEWNRIALAATVTAGQGPLPQSRSMTIVQVSVHDAVNAITGKHRTYLSHAAAPAGASPEAAAIGRRASRARDAVSPANRRAGRRARRVARGAGPDGSRSGHRWGERVAAAILAARASDGAALAQFPYTAPGAGAPGVWVRDRHGAGAAAGLGQRDPVGASRAARSSVPMDRRRSTAAVTRATTARSRTSGPSPARRGRPSRPRSRGSGWRRLCDLEWCRPPGDRGARA